MNQGRNPGNLIDDTSLPLSIPGRTLSPIQPLYGTEYTFLHSALALSALTVTWPINVTSYSSRAAFCHKHMVRVWCRVIQTVLDFFLNVCFRYQLLLAKMESI